MTADPDALMAWAGQLGRYVRDARSTARELLAEAVRTAGAVAVTHEEVAETLEMLAQRRPDRAAEYRAMSESAREWAERHRRWAMEHSAPGTAEDRSAEDRSQDHP